MITVIKIFLATFLTLFCFCFSGANVSAETKPLRFAVFTMVHETCTFCASGDTGIDLWTKTRAPFAGDEVFTANEYIEGFVDAASDYESVELAGLTSPAEVYGGSSASWIEKEAFDFFIEQALADLEKSMPVSGIYLSLHGAMAVRGVDRPEAEIARRFRKAVGPDVPIAATFDLHGNEDEEFLRHADLAFVTKRYPHYDARIQGKRAARSLLRMASGKLSPASETRKVRLLTPTVLQWTGASPAQDIMERARRWEARTPDTIVNVFFGFPWSDVPDLGATVQVITNNDRPLAASIAEDMHRYINDRRMGFFEPDFLTPGESVQKAIESVQQGDAPVVLADYSDRNGDAGFILQAIAESRLENAVIATIRDEHLIARIQDAKLTRGDRKTFAIGGFTGASSGTPVSIEGELQYFGAGLGFETIAAISFGKNNLVIITPALKQITSPNQLKIADIIPDGFDVFVVKSRVHFRRGFDESGFAKSIYIVDAPGCYVGTIRLNALKYENIDLKEYYPYNDETPEAANCGGAR